MYKRLLKNLPVIFFIALTAIAAAAQSRPVEIDSGLRPSFRFVAYGDTRFTDPTNTTAANPEVRQQLGRAIADVRPDFITFGGATAFARHTPNTSKQYHQAQATSR